MKMETIKLNYNEISKIISMLYYGSDDEFNSIESLVTYLEEQDGYIEINR